MRWRPWPARIAAAPVRPDRAVVPGQPPYPSSASSSQGRRPFVPGLLAVRADDRALVALARQQHDVAGPGRLERGGDRGAPVGDELQVLAAPLAGGLGAARDLVEDRLAVLAARVLVGDDDEAGALPGDAAHLRPLRRVALAGRAEHRDEPAATCRRGRREQVEDGLAARPGCGRSRRRRRTAGRHRCAPSGPGTRSSDARPARTAAGSRPSTSPRATTASALWTLNRPASRRSRRRRAAGRLDVGVQAVGVLADADRPDVGGRLRAVGQDAGAGVAGRRR